MPTNIDGIAVSYDVDVSTGPTTDFVIPVPTSAGALVEGDFILAVVSWDTADTTPPSRTLPGADWFSLTGQQLMGSGTTTCFHEAVWHVVTAAEAGTTPTWTITNATAMEGNIATGRFRDVDPDDPWACSPSFSGTAVASGTIVAPAVTTLVDDCLLVTGVGMRNGSQAYVDCTPGYTITANGQTGTGRSVVLCHKAQATAGTSTTATHNFATTSNPKYAWQSALRPAPVDAGDTTAPSVPANVQAVADSAEAVTVTWDASTDDVAVASYRVQRDGVDLTGATAVAGLSFLDDTVAPSTTYDYTVSAVDAAGNRSAESTAATVTTPALAGTLVSLWVGDPTDTTCPVVVHTSGAAAVRLKVGTDSAVSTGVVFTSSATPDADGYTPFTVTGLTEGTAYWFRAEVDGQLAADTGQFTTDTPGQPRSGRIAFGSCLTSGNTTTTAFDNLLVNDPELVIHLGDLHYDNNTSTSADVQRASIEDQIAANDGLRAMLRRPTVWQFSDHDSGSNDWTGGPAAWTPAVLAAYGQAVPVSSALPAGGIYRSVHFGRVKIILTDGRSFKSPASDTDDASKTMFGTTQEAWIAAELADEAYPVKILAVDVPWVYATTAGDDKWGGYTAAAQRLVDAITAAGANVFLIHGDAHSLCADDGTSANNRGGLPVAGSAPFGNTTSIKGGPYSQGTWPTSGNTGGQAQQHGLLDVTDTGDTITVRFSGRDSGNVERVSLSKTFSTLDAPTGLLVSPVSSSELDLSWNAVSGATGYDIERDGVVIVSGHPGTSYSDTGLAEATVYTYRVRAVI